MKNTGLGKANAKIILAGEHSVVYGYPAIAIPLRNIQVICKIFKSEKKIVFNNKDIVSMAIYYSLKFLKISDRNIGYVLDSKIPSKRGMGSSAAVCIATIRSVFDYYEKKLDYKILTYLVNKTEKIAHGNPSGLDAKTCMSRNAIKFIKNKGFNNININMDNYLLIADTGIYGKTKEAVQKVASQKEKLSETLEKLGEITEKIEKNIREKDSVKFGKNMTKAHIKLIELGVSCNLSNKFVNEAIKMGALGAKMSGGGLGGCVIILVENKEKAYKIGKKLKELGAVKIWTEKI